MARHTSADKNPASKRCGRPPLLDPVAVAAELTRTRGNVAAVARAFGVDRTSVRDLIERTPALQQVCKDEREGMKDAVESVLYEQAEAGEAWAVCFFLKTQAKDRGYVEKQEVEHSGVNRLVIEEEEVRADGPAEGSAPPDAAGVPPK